MNSKKLLAAIGTGLLVLAFQNFSQNPTAAAAKQKRFAKGRILVLPKDGLSDSDLEATLKNNVGGHSLKKLDKLNIHVVQVPEQQEEKAIEILAKHQDVQAAELDMQLSPDWIPNDPYYASSWHLPMIQAPTAWETSTGTGITIAILDTGTLITHPDLAPNLLPGWNIVSGNSDITDTYGHGTSTAGTAAAALNNGLGVSGIAGNARILPIKITNDPSGYAYFSDISNGITYAADHGAQVVNVSFGGMCLSSTILNAARYLQSKGGQLVVSAGNSTENMSGTLDPAVVCVSATDGNDNLTSWSSYGNVVSVSAPGAGIWTTSNSGDYRGVNGTSFSSPMTAGVIALIMSANRLIGPADAVAILKSTADDKGAAGYDIYYGYGRINAARAVASAVAFVGSDKTAPTVAIASPTSNSSVSGMVAISVNANDNVAVSKVELFVNGKSVGIDSVSPYQFTWDSTSQLDGSASLVAYAYDVNNNKGTSATVTVTTMNNLTDTMAPTVPANLMGSVVVKKGKRSTSSVQLSWNASTDNVAVAKYIIYRNGAKLAESSSPSFSDATGSSGVAYTYAVSAMDAKGNESAKSNSVILTK